MNLFGVSSLPPLARTPAESIALDRFGLGARPGEKLGSDPRDWLTQQLSRYQPRPGEIAGEMGPPCAFRRKEQQPGDLLCNDVLADALAARFSIARTSDAPFAERLVHFWSNHFSIRSSDAGRGRAGVYEFDAIRPHILGNFRDLLGAVTRHPAMLVNYNQHKSRGGRRAPVENLARETLELHTLGVRSGYSQTDVAELALALTGWTLVQPDGRGSVGVFRFDPGIHEPGERRLLGRAFADGGEDQASAMLDHLARQPATAQHIGTKLARHFAGDEPPPSLVDRLAKAFRDSGGELRPVYAALIAAPEPWAAPRAKFKTPWEWLVSIGRAIGSDPLPPANLAESLSELGQPPWNPRTAAGWDDTVASWASSDALMRRVELAATIVRPFGGKLDALRLADDLLGQRLGPETERMLREPADRAERLALLFVAPEFLYR